MDKRLSVRKSINPIIHLLKFVTMEKEKKTVFVSFATQKGGVGKSTFTIYAASWLHYVKGLNVAVVDCDYPQHSIMKQKKRDMEVVKTTPVYQNLLVEQAGRLKKKAYPVIGSTPARRHGGLKGIWRKGGDSLWYCTVRPARHNGLRRGYRRNQCARLSVRAYKGRPPGAGKHTELCNYH